MMKYLLSFLLCLLVWPSLAVAND
ncbi:TPA: polysaccharide export protein, partial [Vibrio cholerae O1]